MKTSNILYFIEPKEQKPAALKKILTAHPEVKFVSLMGVDLAGNDTDEKIPVQLFVDNPVEFLDGCAAQTDGSSVVLPGIATLNDARVDLKVDTNVNWYVDYNYEHRDEVTGELVGTLRIPCFLIHNGQHVCSRSILADTLDYVKKEVKGLLKKYPNVSGLEHIKGTDVKDLVFTCATELEFWVKTPSEDAPIEALSSSQIMQEQYWQRTRGSVRTALEQCIETMEMYGLEPEMGHKENGGVKGQLDAEGHMTHIMEQLEVDWKYNLGVQTADNEILVRNIVKETFRKNGLDVSFEAKPIVGVAGSGEHTHVGIGAVLQNGEYVNLFSPKDMKKDFLSALGYGALMGLLKNYEVINPFISCTTDAFNRLQPGFEAPVCVVTSLGQAPDIPSRNRTILVGLVRDIDNPKATRFEMRSPNPLTNTYIAIATFYLAALDGMKAVLASGKTMKELEADISKKAGEKSFYLETNRQYRTEDDVFEDFTPAERNKLFGQPPATVWENLQALKQNPEKRKVLTASGILKDEFIESFCEAAMIRWKTEMVMQYLPEYVGKIKKLKMLCNINSVDKANWDKVDELRQELAKDRPGKLSLFTKIRQAMQKGNFDKASDLQVKIQSKMNEVQGLYHDYCLNIID